MTSLPQLSPTEMGSAPYAKTLTPSSPLEGLVDEDFTVLILDDEV